MQSTIKFDLAEDGSSNILIYQENSDDVRDKIANRFFQKLNYDSVWCKVTFLPSESGKRGAIITPITPEEIKDEIEHMQMRLAEIAARPNQAVDSAKV